MSKCQKNKYFNVGCQSGTKCENKDFQESFAKLMATREAQDFSHSSQPPITPQKPTTPQKPVASQHPIVTLTPILSHSPIMSRSPILSHQVKMSHVPLMPQNSTTEKNTIETYRHVAITNRLPENSKKSDIDLILDGDI